MSKSIKDRLIFAGLMSLMMSSVMTAWNLWWADRLSFQIFVPAYLTAVLISFIVVQIVNPLVSIWTVYLQTKISNVKQMNFLISGFRSILMGLAMGLFGLYMSQLPFQIPLYLTRFSRNIIISFPLSYFLVRPLAGKIVVRFHHNINN
ncbi:hypothetical protein HO404_06865 [Streptococcus suis]|nr:hypothetical protein [Streptococcus suis]NQM55526.1 hypothetical protein [Streptococcus suis]